MVRVVKAGYQLSYDKSVLNDFSFVNTKINLRYLLCGPPRSEGEGIFYRIVHNNALKCIQCIAFYKTQWIPYHPHDYHPFYIYLDAAHHVQYLIIDDGHHFSKLIPIPENPHKNSVDITLFLPDHGQGSSCPAVGHSAWAMAAPLRLAGETDPRRGGLGRRLLRVGSRRRSAAGSRDRLMLIRHPQQPGYAGPQTRAAEIRAASIALPGQARSR